jgi:hypothetical protein
MPNTLAQLRGSVAGLSRAVRNGERPQADLDAARADLDKARADARLDAAIAEIAELVSALTDTQRIQLADLLEAT